MAASQAGERAADQIFQPTVKARSITPKRFRGDVDRREAVVLIGVVREARFRVNSTG